MCLEVLITWACQSDDTYTIITCVLISTLPEKLKQSNK